ncbi:AraC family transcriptional regulator [Paraburkholderia rhizosphaerae]|uniref:AraC family transcriptional regulator n=1 Tax=Paraburkholderia rhizosphaerae TaxID=480658 RepID=A0A4R8LZ87_9BURK|nr:AraC family transcriptional regulator [Paraburkholderia rhizosphaerae]TDY53872.1 AraC family transcriptional regulator [Paraburkholderia rhizosphaerae]
MAGSFVTAASPSVALRRFSEIEASDVHEFHQIVLGVDGSMVMAVDGIERQIDRRSAWLVPAGSRHDYAGIGENRHLVLDLPAASLAVPERLFERARTIDIDAALIQLVGEIAVSTVAGGHGHVEQNAAALRRFNWGAAAQLCAALVQDAGHASASAAHVQAAAGLDFARIDRWLRAHLAQPLRMVDLAAHCGFGLRRFHQLFIEAFGETPHRYLQRLRLDTSITLLADPRRSLTDVALDVGFGDQSAYTHAFTRRFGIAPGQWRALRH